MTSPAELRASMAGLVDEVTSGAVPAAEVLAGGPVFELRLDSLGWLRLIDAVEAAYGVELDLTSTDLRLATVDQIVAQLRRAGVRR